jgi:hypothetical protein
MIGINSKVKSRNPRGSIQDVGTVIALFQVDYFLLQAKYDPDHVWAKNYPDWKQKPVALVYFEKPQRTATLQEWIDGAKLKNIPEEEARADYEERCPTLRQTAFPIDDLEEIGPAAN